MAGGVAQGVPVSGVGATAVYTASERTASRGDGTGLRASRQAERVVGRSPRDVGRLRCSGVSRRTGARRFIRRRPQIASGPAGIECGGRAVRARLMSHR